MLLIIHGITAVFLLGIMAEDPTSHHGAINSSLCLHLQKTSPDITVDWTFTEEQKSTEKPKEKLIVIGKKITPLYTDRVDYIRYNHSLCIKNLMKNDSGLYQATITENFLRSTELHMVIVQGKCCRFPY